MTERRFRTDALHAIHVVAGLDVVYGGPSYTVPRLCRALAAAGADVGLLSIAGRDASTCDVLTDGYRDRRFRWDYARVPILRGLRCSSGFSRALRGAASAADVIHGHGLWLMPNVQSGRAAARVQKPLVVSPRGMLSAAALAFSWRKKYLFWHLLQGAVIRRAACIHATSEQECDEIRAFGLVNPVAVIPNGIDLEEFLGDPVDKAPRDRVVLSLGRIHPKKGLDRLVHAWAKVEAGHPGWRLRIIGPSEMGHDAELRALAAALGLRHASFEGPVYGDAKLAAYRDADIFVLPTLNENFAGTVAESLAAGTPVIATKGAPWSGLEFEQCGWWIDHGVEPLAAALGDAMALPRTELRVMGARGRGWMAKDFGWAAIAQKMIALYAWLARGAEQPDFVRCERHAVNKQ